MKEIRSTEIEYNKPPLDDFLKRYNDLFASILVRHFPSLPYLASATLNRLEGQTHFFEKLEKYVQIRNMLCKNPNILVRLVDDDVFLYDILHDEFGTKIIREESNRVQHRPFWVRYLLNFGISLALSIISWPLLRAKKKYTYVLRCFFDFRNIGERLRDEYFGLFADDLGREHQALIVYKLLHVKDLWDYYRIRNTAPFDSCLLESFLTPWMVIKAFARYLNSHIKLDHEVPYKGCDISKLLQKSIDEDYSSMRGIEVYLEYEAAKRILASEPKWVLLAYENQTWEKVYPYLREKMKKSVSIVGFQHSGFSYKLLNFFPSYIEKHLPFFPDKIVTMGEIMTRLLREKAFFPCEIVTGAALRQTKHIIDGEGKFVVKPTLNQIQGRIVYAFSYDLSRYRSIVKLLLEVFTGSNIVVYLKFHPDFDEKWVLDYLGVKLPDNFIPARSIPWDTIYRSIDLALYDDNSIGIEGMISGLKTFMVDIGEPIYDCERLFYFECGDNKVGKDELIQIRKELELNSFIKELPEEIVSDYINQYYSPYSWEHCFKAFVN